MAQSVSLPGLRLARGHMKGALTKLVTYIDSITDATSAVELEVKLNRAEDLWSEFNASQKQFFEFADSEGYSDPGPDFEEFEAKFSVVKSLLLSSIRDRQQAERSKDVVARLADQQQVLIETLNNSNSSRNTDSFLPSIRIEPFSGNYQQWPAFRDMYEGAVHNRPNLSPIQKFHFLKSCLRDEALNLLSHLPICDATYEEAWERLEKRYDRPRYVINSYIKTFMELPSATSSNVGQLRKISDGADEIIRGLNSINSRNRDPWLIFILVNKLDPESRRAWSESSISEDYPTIEELIKFLEQRCEALETCKPDFRDKKLNKPVTRSMHVSSSPVSCPKCHATHVLSQCSQFLGMSLQSRRDFVKSNKICFNCLRTGHPSARCQSKFRCKTCNQRHHSSVHDTSAGSSLNPFASAYTNHNSLVQGSRTDDNQQFSSTNSPSTSAAATSLVTNHSSNIEHRVPPTLLPTAVGRVRDINGKYHQLRILIDTGSQVSFVTESCAQRLGFKRRNARIPISGIGSTSAGRSRGLISLVISSRCDTYSISVNTYILSSVTTNLPTASFAIDQWDYIQGLDLADPTFHKSRPIDLLLGADKAWDILRGGVVRSSDGYPIAQQTIFGWVLAGQLLSCTEQKIVSHHTHLDIDSILQAFWTIEEVDPASIISLEDRKIEEHFLQTHHRGEDGRYIVDLPFKTPPQFGNTLTGAISRLKWMERKFSKDHQLFQGYSRFMEEYLALGHMSLVPPSEIERDDLFYLPHHAVLKPDSASTKLRVVFDGSFKDSTGKSLNDSLMIGPPIQRNLFSVSLRFRRFQFVFTADIVKMFRQIWVSEKDSEFQRIVWRNSPSEPIQHFRLRTVTYGTSSAPFLSVRTLQQHAEAYKNEYPVASDMILNDFYVDDVVSGANSVQEALSKRNSLIELLSKCGMTLSKWQSNCDKLLQNEENTSRENVPLDTEADEWVKILGLYWNSKGDVFSYRLNYTPNEPITKRQILKDVARIFDPLGFLAPSVVQLKILFQELWHRKLDWHQEVPRTIADQWTKYRAELSLLTRIQIPRAIGLANASFELHGFSDASASAYAAVIYSRYKLPNGDYETNLVAAKSRVAPLKQLSIPRLELCAALLLARLLVAVQNSLKITFADVYAWSDSKIVLSWLSSPPRRWNVFVGNRTAEILTTIPRNRWFHVTSQCNPADCASRGVTPSKLCEHPIWWSGPDWLRKPMEDWPLSTHLDDDPRCKAEEKQTAVVSHLVTNYEHPFATLSTRISSWKELLRTVAGIYRFIAICRKTALPNEGFLRPTEIYKAKLDILKWLQERHFSKDIKFYRENGFFSKTCKIINLSPFLDIDGILRVGGRIQEASVSFNVKHPIILPKGDPITRLIALDAHIRFLHPGVSALFALIRQEYWVIGCRNLLRNITHTCIRCFRQRTETMTQFMGNLPPQRVQPSRPFAHCGCDYAGPISLKVRSGRKSTFSKGYISLFVCLVTKAIHLELVSDLTTDAFLAAFRRFIARRGKPSHVYSDNGTNFRGCARLLSELHQLVLSEHHNSLVAESLAHDGISWHFIPPASPHFGGLWEAGVKSVKQHLRRVINNDALTFEQFYTLLTQIEAILNSRPLCQQSDSDLDPLTPAHFFLGESYAAVPEPSQDIQSNRLTCWQLLQLKTQGFWKRWSIEYLTSLQNRPRWQQIQPSIKLNDLVVIKEANLPPGKWAMGRVVEVHPGKDGHIRVVTLKTARGNIVRPIHKLSVLPVS